jgi:hypothetical protein
VVINCSVWGGALLYYFVDARKWLVFRALPSSRGYWLI